METSETTKGPEIMVGRARPAHARDFHGAAKNIPEEDLFFLPYQARWIADESLLKLMEKSRRVGISYGTAYKTVRENAREENRWDSWVSSRDDLTAREFLGYCRKFARILHVAATDLGQQVLEDGAHNAYVLRFANETRIHSLSSNPDALAGKGGNVALDEFALRKDPRLVYGIAKPAIDWGGRLSIISTHRGSYNFFNELVKEVREKGNPKGFSLHRVTLQDALEQHFLWKLQTRLPAGDERLEMDEADYWNYIRRSCADEETFLQEYCCEPADDASAFLEYHLISAAEYEAGEKWETRLEDCQGPLFVGFDVARKKHLSVMWVAEKVGDFYYTRREIVMRDVKFVEQERRLYELLEMDAVRRCCIDASGLGMQLAENAVTRYPGKVEPITFTGPMKEKLAYPVRGAFEDRRWKIPADKKVRADLRAVKKEMTAAGNVRFVAEASEDGHADRFWALALCQHAGDTVTATGRFVRAASWAERTLGRMRARRRRSL